MRTLTKLIPLIGIPSLLAGLITVEQRGSQENKSLSTNATAAFIVRKVDKEHPYGRTVIEISLPLTRDQLPSQSLPASIKLKFGFGTSIGEEEPLKGVTEIKPLSRRMDPNTKFIFQADSLDVRQTVEDTAFIRGEFPNAVGSLYINGNQIPLVFAIPDISRE